MEVKSFLDKNLPLKRDDYKSASNCGSKEAFNYYICDEQNGNSKDTFYSFRYSFKRINSGPERRVTLEFICVTLEFPNYYKIGCSGSERQCKIHPSVSSLIVAFQQIYLMPNGGEVSAETSDNTWILTKSDNKK